MPEISIDTRLAPYGLKAADLGDALTDLTIAEGQELRLTRDMPNLSMHIKMLAPRQLGELKQIIGVPDAALTNVSPRVERRPSIVTSHPLTEISPAENVSLWTAARNAVLNHSSTINATEVANIDTWLSRINPAIYAALFQNITIERNAKLILSPDIHILFANKIDIKLGGQLICRGTITKLDCASLTGDLGLHIPIDHPPVHPVLNPGD